MMHYHVTPLENLAAVLRDGLVPALGPRSLQMGEPEPAVFLFTSYEAMETALSNWLGDEFPEEEALVVLHVDMDALGLPPGRIRQDVSFEIAVLVPVPASVLVAAEDEGGVVLDR